MLAIRDHHSLRFKHTAVLLLCIGIAVLALVYASVLMLAPNYSHIFMKPIDTHALSTPKHTENRLIIPKINVDVPYKTEASNSTSGNAVWRHPEQGSPTKEGNFIITAPSFDLKTTPRATVVASPFYHLNKLAKNDQIIIDYNGIRYGYTVTTISQTPMPLSSIEAPTKKSRLTLYAHDKSKNTMAQTVVYAELMGEVSVDTDNHTSS